MEFKQLKAFVTLAETLNFSRASELLYISQSTLSKNILALEEDLGVRLLIRDTHSVVLTGEGACFLKYAREILGLSVLAEQNVRNYVPGRSGERLHIGYDAAIDATVDLASVIARTSVSLQKLRPQLSIKVLNYPLDQLGDALQQGAIDLAVSIQDEKVKSPFESAAFNSVTMRSNRFVAVVQTLPGIDYLHMDLKEALAGYKIAVIPPHQTAYSNTGVLFDKIGIFPYIHFNNSLVDTVAKVARGEAFTLMPEFQFDKLKVDGIGKVMIPSEILSGDMRMLWKKDTDNRFIQEFVRLQMEENQ